ncbi:MAG: PAS domain S-box protein, partial [Prosthecobacter sp.]
MDAWPEGIYLTDTAWNICHANRAAQEHLGLSLESLLHRPLDSLFTNPLRRRVIRKGRKFEQRAIHLCPDGKTFPVELTVQSLPDDKLLIYTRGVSEQIEGERLSRNQTDYYKALFENTPCGVATFDAHFAIVEVNQTLRKMLGYAERHLYQRALKDIFASDSHKDVIEWRSEAAKGARFSREIEITLRKRDGRSLLAHAVVTLMPDQQASGAYGIIILKDVTARHEAELEVAKQHQFSDKLLRESAAMIGVLDRDGQIVMVNPEVERISGYEASELIGQSMWNCGLLDPAEVPMARSRMKQILQGAERVTGVSRARTKTGELRIIQIHTTATRDAQRQIENIIITAVDITEQSRLQQMMMKTVEQEQARIGHDLHDGVGQLLTGIAAMTEALQGELTGGQKDDAARIFELVRQTIQQVRQLARGMSPSAVHAGGLADALLHLADTVRTNFRRDCVAEIAFDLKIGDCTLSGHLFRSAQESVNNAIRHGNPKHVRIKLSTDGKSHGLLEIFNDGTALDYTSDSSADGIGLSVMKHRANLINAELNITSPASGGVSVICRFPLPLAA